MAQSLDAATRKMHADVIAWNAMTPAERVARLNKVHGTTNGSYVVITTANGLDYERCGNDSKLGQRIGWAITAARAAQEPAVVESITSTGQVSDYPVDLSNYEPRGKKAAKVSLVADSGPVTDEEVAL